jgi:hypothetical protein
VSWGWRVSILARTRSRSLRVKVERFGDLAVVPTEAEQPLAELVE